MIRSLLLGVFALALCAAWWSGAYGHASPEHVADLVGRAGVFGPIAFVGMFVAAEVVHFPGILFVFAAAALWPLPIAIPTAYAGALAGSLVVFTLARRVIPEHLLERLPEWLRRYESLLESHGLLTVIALRLVFFMTPLVHWLLGASRVSRRDYVLGTAIGLAPGIVLFALLGRHAFEHWDALRPWLFAGTVLLVGGLLARRLIASFTPKTTPSP